ncbi:MAG: hypothetical protein ACRCVU_19255 [Flavobacterium sp.]
MKALFRLIVLCFFLSNLGTVFATPKAETKMGYTSTDNTFISKQVCKKDTCKVFCQTEVEVELINSIDAKDHTVDSVYLGDALHFFITCVFNSGFTTPTFSVEDISAYLQQHRAKYLLYQSLKIPYRLV